jgi:hypothetical protein
MFSVWGMAPTSIINFLSNEKPRSKLLGSSFALLILNQHVFDKINIPLDRIIKYRVLLETKGRQDRDGFGRGLKLKNTAILNVWRGFWAKNAVKGVAGLTRMSFQRCPYVKQAHED